MSNELVKVVQRLNTDKAFRAEFLADPKKHLAELGWSAKAMEQLLPALIGAIASGAIILNDPIPKGMPVAWI
jgi:hypothetical protein